MKRKSHLYFILPLLLFQTELAVSQDSSNQNIQLKKPMLLQDLQLKQLKPGVQAAPTQEAKEQSIKKPVLSPGLFKILGKKQTYQKYLIDPKLVKPPALADRLKMIDPTRLQPTHPGVFDLPDNEWVTYQQINTNHAENTLIIGVRPDSLFGSDRNNYLDLLSRMGTDRERMRACTSAYESLKRTLPNTGQFQQKCLVTTSDGRLKKPQTAEEEQKVLMCIDALRNYDSACLDESPANDVDAVKWVSGILYWKTKQQIRCGGTLLNDRQVLAARHCFFQKEGGVFKPIPPEEFHFISWSDGSKQQDADLAGVAVSDFQVGLESIGNFQMDTDVFDYAVINLAQPYPRAWTLTLMAERLDHMEISFARPERFAASSIGGFHRYPALISSLLYYLEHGEMLNDRDMLTSNTWRDHFRTDSLPTCVVGFTQRENRCLLHACQTEGGMSGSAMFSFSDRDGPRQKINIVGVHVRGLPVDGPLGNQCGTDAPPGFANLTVAPSASDIATLNGNITYASTRPVPAQLAME